MQIALNQLAAHLGKRLQPLYTLHGDEALLQQEAQDAIRSAARTQGYSERQSFTVAGAHFDWSHIRAAAACLGLFAPKQILEIRIPSGKPGKDGAAVLQQLAHSSAQDDTTLTLITLPRLDKTAKGSPWFEALQAHGVSVQIDPIERATLPAWIAQRLAQQQQHVQAGEDGQRTLQFFADRVEGNLLAAHQEIQKLALLYPPAELTTAQVQSAVLNVARYNITQLAEAVLSGQGRRAQRMIDGLQAEGEAAVLVHWALAEDIRALKRVQQATHQGKPLLIALRENRVWGLKERLYERVLQHASTAQLTRLLLAAHQVDGVVKGLKHPDWPHDPWQALQRLAWHSAQMAAPPQRSAPH